MGTCWCVAEVVKRRMKVMLLQGADEDEGRKQKSWKLPENNISQLLQFSSPLCDGTLGIDSFTNPYEWWNYSNQSIINFLSLHTIECHAQRLRDDQEWKCFIDNSSMLGDVLTHNRNQMERVTAWWIFWTNETRYSWHKIKMVTKEMKFTESNLFVVVL